MSATGAATVAIRHAEPDDAVAACADGRIDDAVSAIALLRAERRLRA